MKIKTKLLLVLFISLIPSILIGIIFIYQTNKITNFVKKDIPQNVNSLLTASHLQGLAFLIRYYDEVLTQSARNFAFTGDIKWKTRYDENVSKLDIIIKEAIAKGNQADKELFKKVDISNLALIDMENQAMALASKNQKTEAVAILESKKYSDNKKIYADALNQFANNKGESFDQAQIISTRNVTNQIKFSTLLENVSIFTIIIFLILTIILIFFIGAYIALKISGPIEKLTQSAKKISEGKKPDQIIITSNDEIGELSRAFQKMVYEIEKSKEEIEKKVEERTANLNKLNKLMVDRELKMMELKKELASVSEKV
jgi:nitrogen fixation/metabolism regulation signal transduction histidine kinase